MYATPMFYSASSIGKKGTFIRDVIQINPMTHYVTAFRDIIQWGRVPSLTEFLIMYGWAFGLFAVGYLIFRTNKKKYILYI